MAMRHRVVGLLAGFFLIAVGLQSASAGERLVVVELFTAQGCPSCPPADAYLGELAQREDVLALGFHVDYWDFIGWADPYADAVYTRRQHTYAGLLHIPYVFTPQIIVDGVLQGSGSNRGTIAQHISVAAEMEKPWVDVRLTHVGDGRVRVQLPEMNYPGEADVFLVRYDKQHETQITRGENIGLDLKNYNVVRHFQPVATWRGDALDLTIPLRHDGKEAETAYAVIVQEPTTGRIVGATHISG